MTRGIALAATFTLDQIAAAAADRAARLDTPVVAAPYGQTVEPLLDPTSALLANTGVNALLLRLEDLRGGLLDELLAALAAAPGRCTATWLVALTPPSPHSLGDPATATWLSSAERRVADAVAALPGVHLMPTDDIAAHYAVAEVHDEYADRIAHLPYTDEFSAALADRVVRLAATTWRAPRKVVVLDCDDTLWSGVCGEDGAEGVEVGDGHRRVQEFLLAQRSRGKLLCLCSHNNTDDVHAVFDRHAGMVLSLREITAQRIGWDPKPAYLRELSAELGLALNSFIFVDDDPVACASVRAQLPEVVVVEVDRDGGRAWRQLVHEPAFDQLAVTDEDRLRSDWYAAEAERKTLRQSTKDYEEFLARCDIEVSLDRLADRTLERAAQLTARTTQFTLTGSAWTVPELRAFLDRGGTGWAVRVRDVFGDHGVVGLVLAEARDGVLDVPVFLLSCRMLNRRVDGAVLRLLCAEALSADCPTVRLHHESTRRNAPARQFLEQLTGAAVGPADPPGSADIVAAGWATGAAAAP
ncbi:HAD-IIIC family phosphatase [Amycolatopsis sp. lyj-346]|uniref:HAD-IIIC family phosphatase n=1 Tax=Amycolatopsis sp. lyj-346 TaxID=2789289 RepID=UPI00397D5D38